MLRRTLSLATAALVISVHALWADDLYLEIRAVGDQIECTCGCSSTVSTCNMMGCHIRVPINEDIEAGLKAGQSQEQILEAVYEKYGNEMRVVPRTEGFGIVGWAMPFVLLLGGFGIIPFVVRRWRKSSHSSAGPQPVSDQVVDKYRDEIERNLEELE